MKPKIMTIAEMLNQAAKDYFKYGSNEIIIVNLTNQEVFTGKSPADIMIVDNYEWCKDGKVEVTSFRNDRGHISVTFNDTIETD